MFNLTDVIGCFSCKTDEEGNLLIGQEARVYQVPGLKHCPCCQAHLHHNDIIAVGFSIRADCALEFSHAA